MFERKISSVTQKIKVKNLIFMIIVISTLTSCQLARDIHNASDKSHFETLHFEPISGLAGHGGVSRGVAWGDFNQDGFPDLAITNAENGQIFVYQNMKGQSFLRVKTGDLSTIDANFQGVTWTDVNNDDWLDLFVTTENGPNILLINQKNGILLRASAGDLTTDISHSMQACWADVNIDGLIDVYVVNGDSQEDALYLNQDGITFRKKDGPWAGHMNNGRSCAFADPNNDGYADLYIANAHKNIGNRRIFSTNDYYQNNNGLFVAMESGEFVNFHGYSYGVSWFDFDQDGDEDLFVSNINLHEPNWLFETLPSIEFVPRWDSAMMQATRGPAKGHVWADFDNDADSDLFLAEGHGGARPRHAPFDNVNSYFRNDKFQFTIAELGDPTLDNFVSAGAAAADIDRDGDLDLVVANWAGESVDNQLFRNQTSGNYIVIKLVGTESNRLGVGTKVSVTTSDGQVQYKTLWLNSGFASMNEPILHFGLANSCSVTLIKVFWPTGKSSEFKNVLANNHYLVVEGDDELNAQSKKASPCG